MLIHIKVETNKKVEKINKLSNGGLGISVKEKPERNQANRRLLEILRDRFPNSQRIKIVAGHHSSSKIVEITI